MAKNIFRGKEAQEKLLSGVRHVAETVAITLGPRGRNVALQKSFGAPVITNDGVSIAKEITLSDPGEQIGADVIKEVAQKTNEKAGDGTTTSIVVTQSLAEDGFAKVAVGINAMGLRLGMEQAKEEIVLALKSLASPIKDTASITSVATISAESEAIGKIIASTIEKVGKDGVVTVEESQALGVESDVVEGMRFDKGFVSPYMVTARERMEAIMTDAYILCTDKKITSVQEVLPLLEKLVQSGKKEIVIIADDIEGEALTTFVVNKMRGTFSVLGIKAPGYGDMKKELLEDIASVVGATVISESVGLSFEDAELSHLGKAGRVIATKDHTTIVGGKGKKSSIEERVARLKQEVKTLKNKYEKGKVEERIARLSGGVAVLRVGAPTESEMKYLTLKIEDAVNATKAAIEEGIVPGGGVALVRAAEIVRKKQIKNPHKGFSSEWKEGMNIVLSACEAPLRKIAENAGRKDSLLVIDAVKKGTKYSGYDALSDTHVENMIEKGIIDPVKVTRLALEHAISAVAMLLTTTAMVVDAPGDNKREPQGGEGDF